MPAVPLHYLSGLTAPFARPTGTVVAGVFTRSKANIRAELFLLAMAFDLKKLWMKREQGRLQTRVSEKMTA